MKPFYELLSDFPGCECAKRALDIAIAGKHSVLLIGGQAARALAEAAYPHIPERQPPPGAMPYCGHPRIITIGVVSPCPCGFFGHPKRECRCQLQQIQKHVLTWPRCDITVEVPEPSFGDYQRAGWFKGVDKDAVEFLEHAAANVYGFGIEDIRRILAVARTIAKLSESEAVRIEAVSEAIQTCGSHYHLHGR